MSKSPFLGLHPTVLRLASTHFVVDGYGNIYAPLLPLLIPQLGLSLATAGTLQMLFQMANSVAQLGFGRLADRWRPRLLVLVGPVVAVTILSLIGLAPNVWTLATLLMLGGLGGAAFHPPAAALVHRLGGSKTGLAMSVHITGGTIGFSLGPLVFAPFVERFGLLWTPVLMMPGLLALRVLLRSVPPTEPLQARPEGGGFAALRPYVKPLSLLYAIVVLRTLASLSFATFMPVMLTRRGLSLGAAGIAVAAYLFASGVGGFLGGPAADRFGPRRVILISLVASVPFLALAPTLSGWTFVVVLAIGGLLLQSTLPVNVTFGQVVAPIGAATVSSLMMGFAWGTGGLSVPFVGMLADRIGIERALVTMAFMPLFGALLALPLPSGKHTHTLPRAASVGVPETAGMDVAE
ncbi:MAG TPA: MFS transporter [Vicinamibacterales bacterium]|nr:MFS transporter [Vicinamibacterales bacterium]